MAGDSERTDELATHSGDVMPRVTVKFITPSGPAPLGSGDPLCQPGALPQSHNLGDQGVIGQYLYRDGFWRLIERHPRSSVDSGNKQLYQGERGVTESGVAEPTSWLDWEASDEDGGELTRVNTVYWLKGLG
jgi:hypothetical protein